MTYTAKGFGIVNKAEIDVFLELSCFFDDPPDIGNLISDSSVRVEKVVSFPGANTLGVGGGSSSLDDANGEGRG